MMSKTDSKGFAQHNHDDCISDAMSAAESYCVEHALQFTPVRRRVLEILLLKHSALGAYDILEQLREEGLGSQPPIAYRALDFLVSNGFAHKIERMNAFIACAHPGHDHTPAFMICRSCEKVAESQSAPASDSVGTAADAAGFLIERTIVEAEGLCHACRDEDEQ